MAREQGGKRALDKMQWGFPRTITGASGKRVKNVRNYASAFRRPARKAPERRCLVPFTSFSEYGPGRKGNLPLSWLDLPSRPIACRAGVWRPIKGGPVLGSLPTEPNATIEPAHPKAMPVILHPEGYDRWLIAPVEDALTLAAPCPAQLMRVAEPEHRARKPAA